MRIPSVFAIVLVAATGAASAEPARIGYGGQQAPAKPDAPREADGWKPLATPTPAKHGTEFVVVGKDQGSFEKLRIEASRGTLIVRRVKIYFDDGKLQVVDVDRVLGPKRGTSAEIVLKTVGPLDRVVITTETQGTGEYVLYGSSGSSVASR
jgi:hypothetical protein